MVDGIAGPVHWCAIWQVAHIVHEQSARQRRSCSVSHVQSSGTLLVPCMLSQYVDRSSTSYADKCVGTHGCIHMYVENKKRSIVPLQVLTELSTYIHGKLGRMNYVALIVDHTIILHGSGWF